MKQTVLIIDGDLTAYQAAGLANFDDKTIAPMFKKAPKNCRFDQFWRKYLEG
jgi:hypothetical protein